MTVKTLLTSPGLCLATNLSTINRSFGLKKKSRCYTCQTSKSVYHSRLRDRVEYN